MTELGPISTLTPERLLAAFVTEAEHLTARLSSVELVLHPGDCVDLVLRLRVLTSSPTGETDSDPAA